MNSLVGQLAYLIFLAGSSAGAAHEIVGKRGILDGLVSVIDVPVSAMGLSPGIAEQAPPQSIAIQVPYPVAVPVPHPILVPVERPVPFAVDRPVPYPVPIIKKYFIPVHFKARKAVSVLVPTTAKPDGFESESGPEFGGGSDNSIYTNGLGRSDVSTRASGNTGDTAHVEVSTSPATKSAKRDSSFRIYVN